MLCSVCNKNPATIHIQEIVNGVKKTIHVCQSCAVAKGLNVPVPEGINVTEFLHNIISDSSISTPQNSVIDQKPIYIFTCPNCGWDSEQMKKIGRLGCPECYHSLRDKLVQSLSVMHRGTLHSGKIPPSVAGERNVLMANLLKLQKKLEKHIKNEEYEEAAKIRDELKDLKSETLKENE